MALGNNSYCRTTDPGYSSVLHAVFGHGAGLAPGTASLALCTCRSVVSTHCTCPLLPRRLVGPLAWEQQTHRGNRGDTGSLAYQKCAADHRHRHGLLAHPASVCAALKTKYTT